MSDELRSRVLKDSKKLLSPALELPSVKLRLQLSGIKFTTRLKNRRFNDGRRT
jgi:hypothetical protein